MEFELKEFMLYFYKKIWIILLFVMLFFVAGILYCKYNNVLYYETSTNLIVLTDNSTKKNEKNNYTVNEGIVRTYLGIIKSKRVLNSVIDDLKLDIDYNKLYNKINVDFAEKSGLITIKVKTNEKDKINEITNSISNNFIKVVDDIVEGNNSTISVIDKSVGYKKYYSLSRKKYIFIITLLGFILGCIVVYLKYYFLIK